MTRQYYLADGSSVTADTIKNAVVSGTARIIYSWMADGGIGHALDINGEDIDTRGDCFSVWDEQWSDVPTSIAQALRAAS